MQTSTSKEHCKWCDCDAEFIAHFKTDSWLLCWKHFNDLCRKQNQLEKYMIPVSERIRIESWIH